MEKDQSLTAYEIVLHDHNYENTPQNIKKNLDNFKRKLISIVKKKKQGIKTTSWTPEKKGGNFYRM